MTRHVLSGKRVAVIGGAREGTATAEYLLRHGVPVTVLDRDQAPPAKAALGDRVEWRLGTDYLERLAEFEVAFRTPAVPFLSEPMQQALKSGTVITSQTTWFFAESPCPIIGVSGTKGKGTTAGLLARMLEAAGRKVYLGGNIGRPPLEFLDDLQPDDLVVLELSSFQLQDLQQSPETAILTNLTADHLDHHRDLAEYRAAKLSLVQFQGRDDLAIFNADDPGSTELAKQAPGHKQYFSLERSDTDAHLDGDSVVVGGDVVCRLPDIPVPGPHNLRNVMAATLAARRYDVPVPAIKQAITSYTGLPFHLELVGEYAGVRYFNDSYATNPTATIPALESFAEPIVLIAGGHDKGLDYRPLAEAILDNPVKAVVVMDVVGEKIVATVQATAEAANKTPPKLQAVGDKDEILPVATGLAEPGGVVLFSPAGAGVGSVWFDNYRQRGRFFTEQVAKLG